ncbi:hypothetical protein Holit_03105 [Hollandina sp. SP2]
MSRNCYAFLWGSLFYGLTTTALVLITRKLLFGYDINIIVIIITSLIHMIFGFLGGYSMYPYKKRKQGKNN